MNFGPAVLGTGAVLLLTSQAVASIALNTVWTASTGDTYPPSIAAAPSSGAYVASTVSYGSGATLTRYSSTGAQVWTTSVSSSRGQSVGSDAAGNVYIAGETYAGLHGPWLGGSDVFLRKYSPSGTLLWGKQFGTPQYDFVAGLEVTPDGSVYVTSGGWAANYGTPPPGSVTTLRHFQTDGTPGWIADLDPGDGTYPGGHDPYSHGTTTDGQGNVLATFTNYTRAGNRISFSTYLSKTNAAGEVQWIRPTDLTNSFGAATDSAGNMLLASRSLSTYDSEGKLKARISDSTTQLWANVVASDGTIYAAGSRFNSGYVVAYSPTGSLLWSQDFLPTSGNTRLRFLDLAISDSQLIAAGHLVDGSYWSGNYLVAMALPGSAGVVPEPLSLAIWGGLGAGGVAIAFARRRRQAKIATTA